MSIIEFKQVSFEYDSRPIICQLSFRVEPNSFWTIIGPNGSGKSTLLNLLFGLLRPQHGAITLEGKPVLEYGPRTRAQLLAMVRQEFVPAFEYTVMEIVMMGRYSGRKGRFFENKTDRQVVEKVLVATDTMAFADRPLGHLSGGERQRVFIARALAQETPILLLDEPTSHLDLKHQVKIFDLLKEMQCRQGKTVLMVTHDINLAVQYCDRVLLLGSDATFFEGLPEQVLDSGRIESGFGVTGYQGRIRKEKFFVPLGRFSKDQPE